jgi:hypothetical protein
MNTKLFTIVTVLLFSFPVLLLSQKIKYETLSYKDSNSAKRYQISVKYPQIVKHYDDKVQKQLNSIIKAEINNVADDFKKDMEEWDMTDVSRDFSSEFDCSFEIYYNMDNIFSFSFEIFTYYAGAAHPYSYSKCMNLDIENVKIIDLNSMFKDTVSGLNKLSEYCYNDLKKQSDSSDFGFDEDWVKEGTKPTSEYFANILVEKNGLLVKFNGYQVASYAAGPKEVKIPYSELKKVLNPKGPLSVFLK